MSLRHMQYCMSMNVLLKGHLGLGATKTSDIDDFVCRRPQPGLRGLTKPTPNRNPDPNTNTTQQ